MPTAPTRRGDTDRVAADERMASRAMKTAPRRYLTLLALLLGACGDWKDDVSPEALPPVTLPGVWVGVFPCDNCPGIDVRLWLRTDGRFFVEQHYPAMNEESGVPTTAHGLGRWQWNAEERILVLDGEGPDRIFEQPDAETLIMSKKRHSPTAARSTTCPCCRAGSIRKRTSRTSPGRDNSATS